MTNKFRAGFCRIPQKINSDSFDRKKVLELLSGVVIAKSSNAFYHIRLCWYGFEVEWLDRQPPYLKVGVSNPAECRALFLFQYFNSAYLSRRGTLEAKGCLAV